MPLYAKKSLGQNFLMHAQIAERIVHAARLPEGATVLEIGPGTGILTRALLSEAGKVIAVEADGELIPGLEEAFAPEIAEGRLELVHTDIRAFDMGRFLEAALPYHVVANIPYYITGEIIRQFLTAAHKPRSMTLLVQKEVAERIARQKGKAPKESLLSLSVKAFGNPSYCFTVPRGAFRPAPNVDSAVLHIADISGEAFPAPGDEVRFFAILRAGFAHKRKRLAKNLEALSTPEGIRDGFAASGIDAGIRAEDVPLDSWRTLARALPIEGNGQEI